MGRAGVIKFVLYARKSRPREVPGLTEVTQLTLFLLDGGDLSPFQSGQESWGMWAAEHADGEAWGRGRGDSGQAGPGHVERHVSSGGSRGAGETSCLQLWVCLSRIWSLVAPQQLILTLGRMGRVSDRRSGWKEGDEGRPVRWQEQHKQKYRQGDPKISWSLTEYIIFQLHVPSASSTSRTKLLLL